MIILTHVCVSFYPMLTQRHLSRALAVSWPPQNSLLSQSAGGGRIWNWHTRERTAVWMLCDEWHVNYLGNYPL